MTRRTIQWTATILLAVVMTIVLAGCNGVILNAEYSQLLDETAALSNETAIRAGFGRMDANQMADALRLQADVWEKFRAARDGRED